MIFKIDVSDKEMGKDKFFKIPNSKICHKIEDKSVVFHKNNPENMTG